MPGEGLTHGPPANKNAGGRNHRFSRIIRHSLRGGFNAYGVLPGDRAFLPPSPRDHLAQLDLSVGRPGPHAFASASVPFVRTNKSRASPKRPPHPALHVS